MCTKRGADVGDAFVCVCVTDGAGIDVSFIISIPPHSGQEY